MWRRRKNRMMMKQKNEWKRKLEAAKCYFREEGGRLFLEESKSSLERKEEGGGRALRNGRNRGRRLALNNNSRLHLERAAGFFASEGGAFTSPPSPTSPIIHSSAQLSLSPTQQFACAHILPKQKTFSSSSSSGTANNFTKRNPAKTASNLMASTQVKCETTMPMPIEEMPFEKTKKVSPKSMGNIGQERRIKVEIIEQIEPPIDIKEEEPTGGRHQCRCLIDLSSPAKLRRDFYAWLNGEPATDQPRPCLFSTSHSPPPLQMGLMPTSDRLSMLTLAECQPPLPHALYGGVGIGGELPAFLAPSDCSASASSFSSSASASSSSSISPGAGAVLLNCCSFASSIEANSSSAGSACSYPPPPTIGTIHPAHYLELHPIGKTIGIIQMPTQAFGADGTNGVEHKATNGGRMRMRRKRNVDKASGRGTNLYGRSYCPGRPLSMEERAQIIHLFHGGMKVNAISKQLCISHGCVSKIITRFRETGNLMPSSHSECRRRKRLLQQQQQHQHHQQQQLLATTTTGMEPKVEC